MGRGGLEIPSERRLADDGKRLPAMDVLFSRESFLRRGEFLERGWVPSRRILGWWMTGSALQAVDVVVA